MWWKVDQASLQVTKWDKAEEPMLVRSTHSQQRMMQLCPSLDDTEPAQRPAAETFRVQVLLHATEPQNALFLELREIV